MWKMQAFKTNLKNIDLIILLTVSNMKSRYRKTIAGFIWVVLNPLLMYLAQSIIFSFLLKINIREYSLFLLTGLLPWIFITHSLEMGVPVFDDMRDSLKNLNIHPFIFIASSVLDNFINFVLAFFLVLIPALVFKLEFHYTTLLIFIPLVVTLFAMKFLTFIFSLYNIFLRDIRYIISFVINIMFFLTPIFYPRSIVPEKFQFLIDINPFHILIEPFRFAILENSMQGLFLSIAKSLVLTVLFGVVAVFVWKKKKKDFYSVL